MGQSTDGQICYGILFEEDYEFPWDLEPYNGDYDEWWTYGIQGFKHSFELFDENGEWLNGIEPSEDIKDSYYKEEWDFKKSHPKLPITLWNVCSADYPQYIMSVGKGLSASRGYPEELNLSEFIVTEEQTKQLIDFCNEYGIEIKNKPNWYLSSYWG